MRVQKLRPEDYEPRLNFSRWYQDSANADPLFENRNGQMRLPFHKMENTIFTTPTFGLMRIRDDDVQAVRRKDEAKSWCQGSFNNEALNVTGSM